MGIITKEDGKNRVSLMVRMPQGMAEVIDSAVGILYTSRPDFVIEAVRRFIHHVCNEEAGIMLYLQDKKDADRDVRLEFYRESIREKTELFRNSAAEAAARSKRDVDILLSLPKGLASEIDRTVERTGCFRNHHEFVKSATIYLLLQMATDNTNAMLTESFLESNQATSDLREQIARMKREMSGLENRPDERSHGIITPHPGGFEPRSLQIHALQQGEGYKAGALCAPHAERDGFPRLQAQLEEGARKTGHSRQAVPREAEPRRGADLHL